jgi:hypothetical protein
VGSTQTYSIPAGTGSTYDWTVPAGATIVSGDGTNEVMVTFDQVFTGTISVIETNTYGNATSTKTISASDSPQQQAIVGDPAPGENTTTTYSVPNNPGSTYNWTVPNGATIISGQGTNSIIVQFGSSVSGDVSVTESRGGQSAISSLSITTQAGIVGRLSGATMELYPNPYAKQTTLRINAVQSEKVTIRIVDTRGVVVEADKAYYTNQDIELGNNLRSGVYTIQISLNGESQFVKMVKVD